MKVKQAIYFNQNTTLNLSFSAVKARLPQALISYSTFHSNHYMGVAPPLVLAWFNIRAINITQTFIVIYDESANESNNTV